MDVFQLRDRPITDYASYISSFIHIRDEKISRHVDRSLGDGLLWPEPRIQLHPAFAFRLYHSISHGEADGKSHESQHYNLDLIISVGYLVKSHQGRSKAEKI